MIQNYGLNEVQKLERKRTTKAENDKSLISARCKKSVSVHKPSNKTNQNLYKYIKRNSFF